MTAILNSLKLHYCVHLGVNQGGRGGLSQVPSRLIGTELCCYMEVNFVETLQNKQMTDSYPQVSRCLRSGFLLSWHQQTAFLWPTQLSVNCWDSVHVICKFSFPCPSMLPLLPSKCIQDQVSVCLLQSDLSQSQMQLPKRKSQGLLSTMVRL